MAFYKGYKSDDAQKEAAAAVEPEEDFDEDQVDADILDSLFAEEDEENAVKETTEPAPQDAPAAEAQAVPEPQSAAEASQTDRQEQEGTTVITKGTTINGSIISDCSLDVMGTINGDIECLGKLSISGKVVGNSMASEVFVNTERLEGSINSEGCVKIAQKTVVIGDITASSGVIAGAVKGEIDVAGPIVIDSTAVIQGDIKAKSIQMNNGAVLDGHVSLSYAAGVDINNIFEAK